MDIWIEKQGDIGARIMEVKEGRERELVRERERERQRETERVRDRASERQRERNVPSAARMLAMVFLLSNLTSGMTSL